VAAFCVGAVARLEEPDVDFDVARTVPPAEVPADRATGAAILAFSLVSAPCSAATWALLLATAASSAASWGSTVAFEAGAVIVCGVLVAVAAVALVGSWLADQAAVPVNSPAATGARSAAADQRARFP
jgi:cytochrome c biogenesis protein CcdA